MVPVVAGDPVMSVDILIRSDKIRSDKIKDAWKDALWGSGAAFPQKSDMVIFLLEHVGIASHFHWSQYAITEMEQETETNGLKGKSNCVCATFSTELSL